MASITCGNCTGTHTSVREVRECYGPVAMTPPSIQAARSASPQAGVYGVYGTAQGPSAPAPATEKQLSFLRSLLDNREHDMTPEGCDAIFESAKGSKSDASKLIDALVKYPAKPKGETKSFDPYPEVKAGRYAIDIDGTVKFYKVDRPTEGKWAGRTFVKVQASEELHQLRSRDSINAVLKAIIAQGVNDSLARYGQLLGSCGVCGRTLTDETSRELGIGPVCREGL